jgi:DNA modification methylase
MIIKTVTIAEVKPYQNNPRKNTKAVEAVAESIRQCGYCAPIVVDEEMVILAGHTRLRAVESLGWANVEVCVKEGLTDEQKRKYRLLDNKTNELAEWDADALVKELDGLDFDGFDFGFQPFSSDSEVVEDNYEVELPLEPKTKLGDIYQLGRHRLLCGDSTSEADFARLMDGAHAQVAVTSPPYGVGKEYEKAGIEPWFETMRPAIKNICKNADIVCWNIGDLYATGTQFIEPTEMYSIGLFGDNGFRPIWIRIWKKQGMNFGVGPYHLVTNKPVQQYEYITALAGTETEEYNDQEFAWVSAFAGHSYKFVKRLTKDERKKWGYAGIWEISTVRANKEHPAMFPVELPWRCIKMHSDRGGAVLEPFAGCGTTLIACEQTERRCYAMELSPVYCDLIIKRWENFTGRKAEKNGQKNV